MPTAAATPATVASIDEVLLASRSTLPTGLEGVPIRLRSIIALVRDRMMLVDTDAPPATPTLVPPPNATDTAAANEVTSISAASSARTVTSPPPVSTLGMLTIPAATSLSIRFCASARPSETPTAAPLELPVIAADAATATAWMPESSLAVTLSAPSDVTERAGVAGRSSFAIVASTLLSMLLKLSAPVALTPTDAPLPSDAATAIAMPKASESISAWLAAATTTEPSDAMPESSTRASVSLLISFFVSEKPSDAATDVC